VTPSLGESAAEESLAGAEARPADEKGSMSYNVRIPAPLRRFTEGADAVVCQSATLPALITELASRYPELGERICEPDGRPRRFFNIYVNEEDIRLLGGAEYQFRDGDDVLLLPSIAGGCR
jgi:molybdopterin synthase sulfur carrier subunit